MPSIALQGRTKPLSEATIKQKRFIREYLKTGSATDAAMTIYGHKKRDVAASVGYDILRSIDFSELMEQSGLTDSKLLEVIGQGLEAKRHNRPDFYARHKYLETALKAKKHLTNDSGSVENKAITVNVGVFQPLQGSTEPQKKDPEMVVEGEEVEAK